MNTLAEFAGRKVLLLQGPIGPFFSLLHRYLLSNGIISWRVIFNQGDLVFSDDVNRLSAFCGLEDWELRLRDIIRSKSIDTIILFGAHRPAHERAREVATSLGVEVFCLEEGYIRPGFITIEVDGNNFLSPLNGRLPENTVTDPPHPRSYSGSFSQMLRYGWAYYVARGLLDFGKRQELYHRKAPFVWESFCWIRNLFRWVIHRHHALMQTLNLIEHWDRAYYVVALQVSSDANLKQGAYGWTNEALACEIIESFFRSAPIDRRLIFKIHPMDRGHSQIGKLIRKTADRFGIANRVDCIDSGSIGVLIRHARGVVTINSTSGLSAIHHGVSLLVVGQAFYAHPSLANCANGRPDFDAFWQDGFVAPATLRSNYIDWVKQEALGQGDFYNIDGMHQACRSVANKLARVWRQMKPIKDNVTRISSARPSAKDIAPGQNCA